MLPVADALYSVGAVDRRWKNGFFNSDIDIGAGTLVKNANIQLKLLTGNAFYVFKGDGSDFANIFSYYNFVTAGFKAQSSTITPQVVTYGADGKKWQFVAYDGSAWKTVGEFNDDGFNFNTSGKQPVQMPVYSDATRPVAGTAGRVIFNTTDSNLNIDNGANWTLPDGTIT